MNKHFLNRAKIWGGLIALSPFLFISCEEDPASDLPGINRNAIERIVHAATGDTLLGEGLAQLIIPGGALPDDGNVFLGKTGQEPAQVPNPAFEVAGEPITLRLPAVSLNAPLTLSLPRNNFPDGELFLFLYNGNSWYPVAHTGHDGWLDISIDRIDWEQPEQGKSVHFSELIIMGLRYRQTPGHEEAGLKQVTLSPDGSLSYSQPDVKPGDHVLLMVHGWLSNSKRWVKFLEQLDEFPGNSYNACWTFSYNSSWSISENARLLQQALAIYGPEVQIDILAHSMGGLVSRAMLEQEGGSAAVDRLVSLGTPHKGSPLAVFRSYLGAAVAMDGDEQARLFDYSSQGFRDLDPGSAFMRSLQDLVTPPVPYYTLACTNNPDDPLAFTASRIYLSGPDDGIVEVSSALDVPGAVSPAEVVQITTAFAHLKMPDDETVFAQVMDFLQEDQSE